MLFTRKSKFLLTANEDSEHFAVTLFFYPFYRDCRVTQCRVFVNRLVIVTSKGYCEVMIK